MTKQTHCGIRPVYYQMKVIMKFSVFSAVTPEFGIDETVKTVKELGYDGIEWRVASPHLKSNRLITHIQHDTGVTTTRHLIRTL